MRNAHDLATLIRQFAAQHFFAQRICLQFLLINRDHRIGAGRNQKCLRIHAHVLNLVQPHVGEINAIGRNLAGKQRMRNLVKTAFLRKFLIIRA